MSKNNATDLMDRVARMWCRWTHPAPMWPINGQYRCPECLRTYHVPWNDTGDLAAEHSKQGQVSVYRTSLSER